MNLKQLFCRHKVEKQVSKEFLYEKREGRPLGYIKVYSNYKYYVNHYECLKCGKKRMEKERKLVIWKWITMIGFGTVVIVYG